MALKRVGFGDFQLLRVLTEFTARTKLSTDFTKTEFTSTEFTGSPQITYY